MRDLTVLARHVPMSGVSFTDSLTQGGSFTGSYEWGFPGTDLVDPVNRVLVWPMRDGVPQGCYLITKLPNTSVLSPVQQMTGVRVDHELWERLIRQTLTFVGVDQHDIFRDLVRYGLGQSTQFTTPIVLPDGVVSAGMQVPWIRLGTNTSGVVRTRQETQGNTDDGYPASARKNVGNCLTQLTQLQDGPEYKLMYGLDPVSEQPYVSLVLGTPRVGHGTDFPAKPTFDFPGGNVLECSYGVDGETLVNRADVLGQEREGAKPIGTSTWLDTINDGLPLREGVWSEGSVSEQATLDAKAWGHINGHQTGWSLTVSGQRSPVFGSWEIGDFVLLRVKRGGKKLPVQRLRITGWSIKVDDTGLSETITPTLETVPEFVFPLDA